MPGTVARCAASTAARAGIDSHFYSAKAHRVRGREEQVPRHVDIRVRRGVPRVRRRRRTARARPTRRPRQPAVQQPRRTSITATRTSSSVFLFMVAKGYTPGRRRQSAISRSCSARRRAAPSCRRRAGRRAELHGHREQRHAGAGHHAHAQRRAARTLRRTTCGRAARAPSTTLHGDADRRRRRRATRCTRPTRRARRPEVTDHCVTLGRRRRRGDRADLHAHAPTTSTPTTGTPLDADGELQPDAATATTGTSATTSIQSHLQHHAGVRGDVVDLHGQPRQRRATPATRSPPATTPARDRSVAVDVEWRQGSGGGGGGGGGGGARSDSESARSLRATRRRSSTRRSSCPRPAPATRRRTRGRASACSAIQCQATSTTPGSVTYSVSAATPSGTGGIAYVARELAVGRTRCRRARSRPATPRRRPDRRSRSRRRARTARRPSRGPAARPTDSSCTDTVTVAGPKTYTLVATERRGHRQRRAASWSTGRPRRRRRRRARSPRTSRRPSWARTSRSRRPAPTRRRATSWTDCTSTGPTCTTTAAAAGPLTYTVAGVERDRHGRRRGARPSTGRPRAAAAPTSAARTRNVIRVSVPWGDYSRYHDRHAAAASPRTA